MSRLAPQEPCKETKINSWAKRTVLGAAGAKMGFHIMMLSAAQAILTLGSGILRFLLRSPSPQFAHERQLLKSEDETETYEKNSA